MSEWPGGHVDMTDRASAEAVEQLILSALHKDGCIENSWHFAENAGLEHQTVVGGIKSLLVDRYVLDEPLHMTYWELTGEGRTVSENGSPEITVFNIIAGSEGCSLSVTDLNQLAGGAAKIGLGACMKNKWIKKEGSNLVKATESVHDTVAAQLHTVAGGDGSKDLSEAELKALKRRQLIEQKTRKSFRITRGPEFSEKRVRKLPTLTKDMLALKTEVTKCYHNFASLSFCCLFVILSFIG